MSYAEPLKVEEHTCASGGSNLGQVPGTHTLHSLYFPISDQSYSLYTAVLGVEGQEAPVSQEHLTPLNSCPTTP